MTRRRAFLAAMAGIGLVGSAKAQQEKLDWDCQWQSNIDADGYDLVNLNALDGAGITNGKRLTDLTGGELEIDGQGRLIARQPRVELDSTSAATITGSGSGPTQIDNPSATNNARDFQQTQNGVVEFVGEWEADLNVTATVVVSGANTTAEITLQRNGSRIPRTAVPNFTSNSNQPFAITTTSVITLTNGDTLSLTLENTGGSADLDVDKFALTI